MPSSTGGEALLNPEWRGIVSAADGMGLRTSLFTNGTLIKEEDADFLAGVKNLKEVQLSLYALDEAAHDAVTGLQGSCADFCDFCFSPHITANRGELGKVDADFCKFVALRKAFAQRRDVIMESGK